MALAIFLAGLSLNFVACACVFSSRHTSRSERVSVSVVLGLGLFLSYAMLEPLLFDSYDDFIYVGPSFVYSTAIRCSPPIQHCRLVRTTQGSSWPPPRSVGSRVCLCTSTSCSFFGHSSGSCWCWGVYLVIQRVCRSPQAGGIGVLIYADSPQFYGFDAQYAYETIGLAFAVATVYLLFLQLTSRAPESEVCSRSALGSVVAVLRSHHVTGWLTVGLLVAWFVGVFHSTSYPVSPHQARSDTTLGSRRVDRHF